MKTTRLLTPDGTLFRLSEGVTVPANGELPNVAVYADKEGKSGDIGPVEKFIIPGLNDARQKEVYASSDTEMTGGVRTIGVLSKKDVEDAKKQLELMLEDAGKARLAGTGEEPGIFSVVAFDASTEAEVGEEMSEFVLSGTATVAAVSYDADALTEWATMQLAKKAISDAEMLHSASEAPTLTFASYDAGNNTATMRLFYDGSYTLNPESRQIEKSMFFGKNRDEVRRYVLSLDHVSGVEVDLQPAWMQTVPHVHDHVTVIVQEVE